MHERDDDLESVVDDALDGDDVFEADEDDDVLIDGSDEDEADVADVADVVDDVDSDADDEADEAAIDPTALDAVGDHDDDDGSGDPPVDLALLEGLEVETELVDGEDDDVDDVVTPDEFVCRSCHMAKRWSALADEDAMLCRDCA